MNAGLWVLRLVALSVFAGGAAFAYISPKVELSGRVSDFDDHYLFLNATTERYRVDRASVPAAVELRPGLLVSFEIPLDSLRVLPLPSVAAKPPANYRRPRRRLPYHDSEY